MLQDVRCAGKKVCVLVALPWMCVQAWQGMCNASMCQTCTYVILHNRHQQLGSHRIMFSVEAEKALPWGTRTDPHPVVLDDPLDSLRPCKQGRPLNHLAMAEHFTPLIK